jgi:hypothetical protein
MVSLKSMVRIIEKEREGFLIELASVEAVEEAQLDICVELQSILSGFKGIFEMLNGLPSKRGYNIVLKEGSSPISVRSYRYPEC